MYFTTSTIKDWIHLLARSEMRQIILDSLRFLIEEKRIRLHGNVIMPNHLHKIFSVVESFHLSDIFRDFHKFTSQQFIKILRNQNDPILKSFLSDRPDRQYQIWQTKHGTKEIVTYSFFNARRGVPHLAERILEE